MLRPISIFLAVSTLAASTLVGCGSSDDGDGNGNGNGTLDGNKALSDLTHSELETLCRQNEANLRAGAENACTIIGLLEDDEASCEATRDECAADPDGLGSFEIDCDHPEDFVDYSDCDVTVSELQACGATLLTYTNGLSCSQAGNVPAAPACADDLADRCPNALTF
jgi:hypothetical protein